MKREFEIMPVTSDEVIQILGSLNIEDVENRTASMPKEINNSQPYTSPPSVCQKASRIRTAIQSIKLYLDFDHRDLTSRGK